MLKTIILLFLAFGWAGGSVLDGFDLKDYFRMPLMSTYDHYNQCMFSATAENPTYCVTRTKIKPDPENLIWNYTKEFSDVKMLHFRHDVVTRGVCIESCLKKLSKISHEGLDIENFNDEDFTHDPSLFKDTLKYRKELHHTVNMCVNLKLKEEYNLTGYSTINHCDAENDDYSYDLLDKFFVFVVFVIVTAAFLGTFYHLKFKKPENHGVWDKVLMSFSLKENYKRLMAPPTSQLNIDLQFVQALRYITMFLIVYGHTDMGYNMNPANPEYIEARFHDIVGQLFLNGTMFVQTFFLMSGGLMSVHFINELITKKKFNLSYFWIACIYRYIRLTPVYALILLFDATLLNKMNRGPFWKPIAEIERHMCRNNWYQNLLYVNNYFNIKHGCMIHTWYLAADTQLFIFGMLVMMAVWRFPKHTKMIISTVVTTCLVIPGIVTYFYEFDGAIITPPEPKRDMSTMKEFQKLYVPGHMNAGSYAIGIVAGFIIHQYREANMDDRTRRVLGYMFWLVPIFGILNMEASNMFYFVEVEKPAIWISLFSILSRIIWGLLGFMLIFAAIFKASAFVNKIFNAPIFQPLGRITFCLYLVHMPLMRVLGGGNKGVINISTSLVLSGVFYTFILSTILGAILCLTVEFPITALTKILLDSKKQAFEDKKENEIHEKEEDESAIKIDVVRHDEITRETRQI